ncbi:MAG: NAD-dependent epimerase/dehydratase family protein [Paraglaciecola sp.]|uniref:NAD-dependent epimerase/dehydratase family protein n=1 Tax=Paraglaciecola sp. TaxID=1920173 RepID=UPI003296B304
MKILVLGGDGFCGWPTALNLSDKGHDVVIVDNLSRRKIDVELSTSSLTPIETIDNRLAAWQEISGKKIDFECLDISSDFAELVQLLIKHQPDTIVHFAEQRAAPYSMKSSRLKNYTVRNNLCGTHNILNAIVESGLDIHLVHLGTMGVYGYGTAGMSLPEGYLQIYVQDEQGNHLPQEILYPANPGSIYHMTKTQDALFFQFYNKNDKVRITDLHQGIVWGTQTEQTSLDERLINRFDYDGDYGTVLNRFLVQAAMGYPMTVHGTGGQTRAFIHIKDSVKCVELAIDNPPEKGEKVQIFNQMAESHCLIDLAKKIAKETGAEIAYVPNPRNEAPENQLRVKNDKFKALGWNPKTLDQGLLQEVSDVTSKYMHRCDKDKIPCQSLWTKDCKAGAPNPKVQPKLKKVV